MRSALPPLPVVPPMEEPLHQTAEEAGACGEDSLLRAGQNICTDRVLHHVCYKLRVLFLNPLLDDRR